MSLAGMSCLGKQRFPQDWFLIRYFKKIVCLKGDQKGIINSIFPSSLICFDIMNPTTP